MSFLNEDRRRYYGIRVGDYVRHVTKINGEDKIVLQGTVVELGGMDNNRCYVVPDGEDAVRSCVAEWLTILRPVETWLPSKQPDAIITKDPYGQPPTSQESLDHYGGYVVAESINPHFRNLIQAAPAMFEVLKMLDSIELELTKDQREALINVLKAVYNVRTGI